MTPLIMRELSIAWGQKDRVAMARLLTRFAPLLYVVAAYFSCFTLAEARPGEHLRRRGIHGGHPARADHGLYPLHQAYGQLAGSVFHATGRTRVLRNIAALECVYGFATAWFLLAPPGLLGLNLGAVGLALKTVCVQCLTVNLYLWLASRFIPLNFWRNFAHQIWSLAALLLLAFACRELTIDLASAIWTPSAASSFPACLQPALPGPLPGRAPGAGPFPPGIARAVHPPEKIPPGCVGQTSIMLCSCHRYMP